MMYKKRSQKNPLETEQEAREVALGLLARREHSKRELVQKLRARDCPEDIITHVIDRLAMDGMQSDDRFAESFVRSRIEKGSGPIKMRAEMMARGLDEKVINKALESYTDWWHDMAMEVYRKKFGEGPAPEDFAERARQAGFLQQRGFTSEQIQNVLNNAGK